MEPGVRKILPRVQPSEAERDHDGAVEPTRNGTAATEINSSAAAPRWRPPVEEEPGHKRKRQHVEEGSQSQTLPSLRQLLTAPSRTYAAENDRLGSARIVRTLNGAYVHEGPYKFLAPHPSRDFPVSVSSDARELSFAMVEPELMMIFRCAWNLRHYIRLKRLQGEHWLDHVFFNDSYGIENMLYNWTSRYEPGSLQYPLSVLYKHCLWLFFNRSIQASQTSPAFAQVVDDGVHFLRTIENALGPAGDRSVLLIPLFLLGSSAFYPSQRREVWEGLDRLDPHFNNAAVDHAAKSLERTWEMMEDGRAATTWEWERYQAHESTMAAGDRSLIDLLWDPLLPAPQVSRVRSPEAYEFDASRFRAAPAPAPPHPPAESTRNPLEAEVYTPPHNRSPAQHHSTVSVDASESIRTDGHQDGIPSHVEITPAPRPFLAPPPPSNSLQANSDVIQVLHRKSSKAKSSVPPCSTCGKELKNPSDAQKHQLQHSKPFRCCEPGCTRTQGFATENDLQRHRKSVHGASPRIGNKIGYICSACPEPSDGTTRKWWPRLDNFKAHIRRKHQDADEESLIQSSASARRPGDEIYHEPSHLSQSLRWPDERHYEQNLRYSMDESSFEQGYDRDEGRVPLEGETQSKEETENSDRGSRSPKTESRSSMSGSDPMDVSPTDEQES